MCLVKVNNSQKPVVACATNIIDGMEINTYNHSVYKMREDILEFLLINHPLDCPICDQGGECDLQDQLIFFGSDTGRFKENKRTVIDKNIGSFISTTMTRCIHCTRCVRYSNEISGVSLLGTTGRGLQTEITNYVANNVSKSALSGNLIDVCPVGAITSKSYAFISRPWELTKTESIDIFDSLGSSIRIDSRGSNIVRILPKYNSKINDEWCTDKVRFNYDSLKYLRITIPMIKIKNFYHSTTWENSFRFFKHFYIICSIKFKNLVFSKVSISNLLDIETLDYCKQLMNYLCGFIRFNNMNSGDFTWNFAFQNSDKTDLTTSNTFILGLDVENIAPILNLNLRKSVLNSTSNVFYIGPTCNLNYNFKHIGISKQCVTKVSKGSSILLYYLSQGVINSIKDYKSMNPIKYCNKLINNSLHEFGSVFGHLNTRVFHQSNLNEVFNYNITKIQSIKSLINSIFLIYQGSHGNYQLNYYNLILPTGAYTESNSYYLNSFGLLQQTRIAVPLIGLSKINSDVLYNLLCFFGIKPRLNFNYKFYMNQVIWFKLANQFKNIPQIETNFSNRVVLYNYYRSDVITYNSKILFNV